MVTPLQRKAPKDCPADPEKLTWTVPSGRPFSPNLREMWKLKVVCQERKGRLIRTRKVGRGVGVERKGVD